MKDYNFISFRYVGGKRYCLDVSSLDVDAKENIRLILDITVPNTTSIRKVRRNINGKFFKKETEVDLDFCVNILGISELQ